MKIMNELKNNHLLIFNKSKHSNQSDPITESEGANVLSNKGSATRILPFAHQLKSTID